MASPRPPDTRLPPLADEFDEILRVAHPNPTREGCPPRRDLIAIAQRDLPLADPTHAHLLACSPCYLEVVALEHALGTPRVLGLTRHAWLATAGVACLAVIGWLVLQMFEVQTINTHDGKKGQEKTGE